MPYLQTRDQTRLFYTDSGTGQPIVFIASAWLGSRMWDFQTDYLASRGCRCIAYDRRGHGRSDWTWEGYDYGTLADDLAALVDHLDLRDVTLVSHSAGSGEIVQYLTRHGTGRVAKIVLVSGTTPCLMKRPDNPEGIDSGPMQADLAARTADRNGSPKTRTASLAPACRASEFRPSSPSSSFGNVWIARRGRRFSFS